MAKTKFHPSVTKEKRDWVLQEYEWKAKECPQWVLPAAIALAVVCAIGLGIGSLNFSDQTGQVHAPDWLDSLTTFSIIAAVALGFWYYVVWRQNSFLWDRLLDEVNPHGPGMVDALVAIALAPAGVALEQAARADAVAKLQNKLEQAEIKKKIQDLDPPPKPEAVRPPPSWEERRRQMENDIDTQMKQLYGEEDRQLAKAKTADEEREIQNRYTDLRRQLRDRLSRL